ncbi:anaerobic sulfite reductase subunit AsrB [Tissierella sp. MSJ-40]|uniref:Anaerobic sulfite reductase subunit AsrB n=1 Tax=Tissierella simiarum TaxID=2841534 RepID=A0ABS6E0Z6_9FIRM|nr:anaerobic sulfite reductase subunit AsrB [Tissierella simiarum]MBU5436576.1 anaerobic sulfite reductase subunit AsrB [Tissierella simiarum]
MNPYMTYPAKIKKITKHTDIDYTFFIEKIMDVKGGQFIQVSVPKFGEVPISISDYNDELIELTIRKVGRVTDAIFNKNVGDNLHIRGPYGNNFDPEIYFGKDLIMVTGGTGLAPVKSIINYFHKHLDKLNSFKLISGFKSSKDILFKESFEKWEKNMDVCLTIDTPEEGWTGNTGFVTEHVSKLDLSNIDNVGVIMVGPPPMMKFTGMELSKLGIKDEQIWVSFERKMSCGIGKCGHCKIDETYICLEGPVFRYDKTVKLID